MREAKTNEFTFPVSGEKVHVGFVSVSTLAMKLQRKYPRPSPPLQDVDFGGGVTKKELNYLHPDYAEAVAKWNEFIDVEAMGLALKRIFNISLTADQKKDVKAWKKENVGFYDDDDSDVSLWIEEIACETDEDLTSLIEFATGGDPTQGGIDAQTESF